MATKDFSSKQEKMIADYLGWKVVSGSGARACHPGDIIGEDWLGECKTHVSAGKPIFFSSDVWKKICEEAVFKHRSPVLFADDGSQKLNKTWCMINQFSVPEDWKLIPMNTKFKTNFSMKHEYLSELYKNDDKVCHTLIMNTYAVGVMPIGSFKRMFEF